MKHANTSLVAETKSSPLAALNEDASQLAQRMVDAGFGSIKVLSYKLLPYAFTNVSLLLTLDSPTMPKVVLKIATKLDRLEKLALETALLERVAKETTIPCPQVLYADFTMSKFTYPFVFYSFLEGENLVDAIDDIENKEVVGAELAMIAVQLHKLDFPGAHLSLSDQTVADSWLRIVENICDRALELLSKNGYARVDELRKYVDEHLPLIKEPAQYSLVHRDLQPQNLHWDKKAKKIVGLFDFESSMSGDHHFEFSMLERKLFRSYPEIKREFYATYRQHGQLSDQYEELVSFYEAVRDFYFYVRDIEYASYDRAQQDIESIEGIVFKRT